MTTEEPNTLDRWRAHVHPSVFVAATATVVGEVTIAENSSVWFSAVVRGDGGGRVQIGRGTNVQDGAIVHGDAHFSTRIGDNVSLGHAAIVHGATVENNVLIGIGARVLSGAHVGEHSLIAAGALVLEGAVVPPRSVVVGLPGRVIGQVSEENVALIHRTAENYVRLGATYRGETSRQMGPSRRAGRPNRHARLGDTHDQALTELCICAKVRPKATSSRPGQVSRPRRRRSVPHGRRRPSASRSRTRRSVTG